MAKENAEKLKTNTLSQVQQSAQQERDERQEKGQEKNKVTTCDYQLKVQSD